MSEASAAKLFKHCLWAAAIAVSLSLAACRSQETSQSEEGKPIQFVQVSDPHLGADNNLDRLRKVEEEVNSLSLPIKFVVFTGDIFDDEAQPEELVAQWKELEASFKAPVRCLPGNHDIKDSHPEKAAESFEIAVGGGICSKAICDGVLLLFAYVEPLAGSKELPGYSAMDWIESSLKDSGGMPAILFLHSPPCDSFYSSKSQGNPWDEKSLLRLSSILKKGQVKAVVAGHLHRDELHWIEGVPLFVAPPVAAKFGRQPCYRIYSYKDGKLEYTTQYLDCR